MVIVGPFKTLWARERTRRQCGTPVLPHFRLGWVELAWVCFGWVGFRWVRLPWVELGWVRDKLSWVSLG